MRLTGRSCVAFGDVIDGRVVHIVPFGSFIRTSEGVDGLLLQLLDDKGIVHVRLVRSGCLARCAGAVT